MRTLEEEAPGQAHTFKVVNVAGGPWMINGRLVATIRDVRRVVRTELAARPWRGLAGAR